MSLELAHRDMVRRRMMVVANGAKRTLTEPRYRSGFMSTRPSSRRRRSGVVRSNTGSVPRAINPDLRLESRRLKDHPRGAGIEIGPALSPIGTFDTSLTEVRNVRR